MKVYQLRLIMGKTTNYDQNGMLKNHVMTVKYAGELELENILEDQNWKKLGACEISCVDVYDSDKPTVSLKSDMDVINARINSEIQAGIKPKTEIELLKDQIAALTEKVNSPVVFAKDEAQKTENDIINLKLDNVNPTEKEIRSQLFIQAAELGLTPAKNVKTAILKDLIANAKK